MIVVGLTGKAGAGKDTVADRLVERHGFQKMALAGPLKGVLGAMDPIIGTNPYYPGQSMKLSDALARCGGEDGVKKLFPEYRRLLQKLGTEGIRSIDPEFWIKAAMQEIYKLPKDARVVFTDVRFPNEADVFLYRLHNTATTELWQVDRPQGRGELVAAHASEDHVGNMGEQVMVRNNGLIEDLHWIVDNLARDLVEVEKVKLAA